MPAPRLDVTVRDATAGLLRLEKFRADSESLSPVHQYLIAELIMLRLFSILESAIEDLACKLVAGASYTNGTRPNPLVTVRSIGTARKAMVSHGRAQPVTLRWNRSKYIRESTSTVLCSQEPFIKHTQRHGGILNEMRLVRHHIAHRSPSSRKGYRQVVRSVYGANSRIGVGAFLTSKQRRPTAKQRRPVAKIDEYLATARIMISELAQG